MLCIMIWDDFMQKVAAFGSNSSSSKPACQLASFRPVSLTSCVVKTLERMIANRLYALAEEKGWISTVQPVSENITLVKTKYLGSLSPSVMAFSQSRAKDQFSFY